MAPQRKLVVSVSSHSCAETTKEAIKIRIERSISGKFIFDK
jgi:hypothetical protein